MRALLPLLVVALLGSSGCIANMADLKDKVGRDDVAPEPLVEAFHDLGNVTNLTPPVARIKMFGENNALLYDAGFKAEDVTSPLFVPRGVALTLLSGDSEALHPGATLVRAEWTLHGQPLGNGTKVEVTLDEPGLHPLTLTVTDSNNRTDEHTLALAVAPDPFEAYLNMTTDVLLGAEGTGQAARLAFDLSADLADVPATIQDVRIVASPPATCDAILTLLDGDGNEIASVNDADLTTGAQTETLEAGALPEAGYALRVAPAACVAMDGFPVQVIVTFLPIIEGLESGGDGHAHAH